MAARSCLERRMRKLFGVLVGLAVLAGILFFLLTSAEAYRLLRGEAAIR